MLRSVALVRTYVSEERIASIIRVERNSELGTLAITSNFDEPLTAGELLLTANDVPSSLILSTPMMEELHSSEMSVLTRVTQRHIPEDGILHSHRRENLEFDLVLLLQFHI
jgi:hypothetical protein